MKLYLIRHGESVANRDNLFSLPTVPLTENGIRDAESVGRLLSGVRFDRVLVSPYLRARQTQEYAMPSVTGEITDDLHECSCGSLEGYPTKEMRERYPSLSEEVRVDDYRAYGGENYEDIRKRVRSFMAYVTSLDCETVAAFTHAGFLLTFFDEVTGRDGKPGRNVRCRNGSVSIFEYTDGKWYLSALNLTERM